MPTGILISQLTQDTSAPANARIPAYIPGGSPLTQSFTPAQILSSIAVTTLTGSVSGHAYCSQPTQAALYKRVVIVLVNWKDAGQAYNFPAAFANLAQILQNADNGGAPLASTSLTVLTLASNAAGSAINAVIVIEGN